MSQTEQYIPPMTTLEYEGHANRPPFVRRQEELFDYQVKALVHHKLMDRTDAELFRSVIPEDGFFVLFPETPKKVDLNALVAKIKLVNPATGKHYVPDNYLLAEHATNLSFPACMFIKIDDGRGRLNMTPEDAYNDILAKGRIPYSIWHGIVHAILFPEVLYHHDLDMVWSNYRDDLVPTLKRQCGQDPLLSSSWKSRGEPQRGAPSGLLI